MAASLSNARIAFSKSLTCLASNSICDGGSPGRGSGEGSGESLALGRGGLAGSGPSAGSGTGSPLWSARAPSVAERSSCGVPSRSDAGRSASSQGGAIPLARPPLSLAPQPQPAKKGKAAKAAAKKSFCAVLRLMAFPTYLINSVIWNRHFPPCSTKSPAILLTLASGSASSRAWRWRSAICLSKSAGKMSAGTPSGSILLK